MQVRCRIFWVVVWLLAGTGLSETPGVSFWARSLQPGEVVRVTVSVDQALDSLAVHVFDRTFQFASRDGKTWTGLVGIDLETRPGPYRVVLEAKSVAGPSYPLEPLIWKVEAKEFPTRRLTVEEKFVNPPAEELERIRRERETVSAVLGKVSQGRLWEKDFTSPVPGAATSGFGKRSVLNGQPRSPHTGTDFSAGTGTPVKAPSSGRVVLADNLYYAGNTIIIDHGQGLYSFMGHLSAIDVTVGSRVEQGDPIGKVGATGRVTGPHLHWAVRLAGTRVDPLSLMAATAGLPGSEDDVQSN